MKARRYRHCPVCFFVVTDSRVDTKSHGRPRKLVLPERPISKSQFSEAVSALTIHDKRRIARMSGLTVLEYELQCLSDQGVVA
jgi:hypothetical protein